MARIHDNGLAELGPIKEGGPMERPLAFHARLGQQFCDAGDPPAIDGRNDPGDVLSPRRDPRASLVAFELYFANALSYLVFR